MRSRLDLRPIMVGGPPQAQPLDGRTATPTGWKNFPAARCVEERNATSTLNPDRTKRDGSSLRRPMLGRTGVARMMRVGMLVTAAAIPFACSPKRVTRIDPAAGSPPAGRGGENHPRPLPHQAVAAPPA